MGAKDDVLSGETPAPVLQGSVFAAVLQEATQLVQELGARRRFDADVSAWLGEMGFAPDFEAWRKARG